MLATRDAPGRGAARERPGFTEADLAESYAGPGRRPARVGAESAAALKERLRGLDQLVAASSDEQLTRRVVIFREFLLEITERGLWDKAATILERDLRWHGHDPGRQVPALV